MSCLDEPDSLTCTYIVFAVKDTPSDPTNNREASTALHPTEAKSVIINDDLQTSPGPADSNNMSSSVVHSTEKAHPDSGEGDLHLGAPGPSGSSSGSSATTTNGGHDLLDTETEGDADEDYEPNDEADSDDDEDDEDEWEADELAAQRSNG